MITTAEALLALRAPGADWLATLITALDESRRDPEFSPHLREIFAQLAAGESLPPAVVAAAHRRTHDFTQRLTEEAARVEKPAPVAERPRLTLVVG
jgi:hypothetical protein